MKRFLSLIWIISLLFVVEIKAQNDPLAILLTWNGDPTSSMVVDWHNMNKSPQHIYVRQKGSAGWDVRNSAPRDFVHSDRTIHRVELTRLNSGTSYEIKFQENGRVYNFQTMPADISQEPVRIAIGGDTMHEKQMLERTNSQVLKFEPHFVVMGGDMAYENGAPEAVGKVYDWLDGVKNTLITSSGRIIPVIVGLGNHEVAGGYYSPEKFSGNDRDRETYAPYFYNLYAFPGQPGYGVLDFGKYLSLFILDTDHANPIIGKQTEWLASELKKRSDVTHIIPVYHIPAYPSVRDFNGERSAKVREHWLPLFERHNVKVAFENHDHAYKRTYPILNNKVDEKGIVFLGDGAWGVRVRDVHKPEETWYLDKALSERHFILLTIQGRHQQITVVNEQGEIIDRYPDVLSDQRR